MKTSLLGTSLSLLRNILLGTVPTGDGEPPTVTTAHVQNFVSYSESRQALASWPARSDFVSAAGNRVRFTSWSDF
jgi:hypothetical protein